MNFNDVVKLIMKETGKGYNESAQILDKAIEPVIKLAVKELIKKTEEASKMSDAIRNNKVH